MILDDRQWTLAQGVWLEFPEPNAPGFRDCMQSSYLDLLVSGGVPPWLFKLGVRSVAERERFEDAEGLPESQQEQGLVGYHYCDVAAKRLYGVTAFDLAEESLAGALTQSGLRIALTGMGAGLPSKVTVRHSVSVIPIDGQVRVYDPDWKYIRSTSVANILAWHRRLPQDIRYVYRDEFVPHYVGDTAMNYTPIDPVRLVDSRETNTPLVARTPQRVQVTGGGIPASATAVTGSLTLVKPLSKGYAAILPIAKVPQTSTLNFVALKDEGSGFTSGLDATGGLAIISTVGAHFCLDITGYFE
jgi:hypothetical protein